MSTVKAIPQGYHSVTPYLVLSDAAGAIDFYKRALGAQELLRMPAPDGKIMHAEIKVGDSPIMLSDEFPEYGTRSPKSLGGTPASLYVYVENVDAVFNQAVAAGAKALMPLQDMFWGDRYAKLEDPFGHQWQLATHVEDLTPEEIGRRAAAAFTQ